MTQIWLAGDHYKWRAMHTCCVKEQFITGNASDWEKFEMWARTVQKTIRNPLVPLHALGTKASFWHFT
jgi:glucuronate isomerase